MHLIKPLAFTLLASMLSPPMAQVCNPNNPKGSQVGSCDSTDDGLCIVNGQQHTCVANEYGSGGGVCQTACYYFPGSGGGIGYEYPYTQCC